MGRINIYLGASDNQLEEWYEGLAKKTVIKDILLEHGVNSRNQSVSGIISSKLEIEDSSNSKSLLLQEREERLSIHKRLDQALQTIQEMAKINLELNIELMGLRNIGYVTETCKPSSKVDKKIIADLKEDTTKNGGDDNSGVIEIDFGGLMDG